jgi:UDP-N-acetylmuramyl pentapeptide synthase
MGAAAADVVLVLGDVGQVREVAEGAHHQVGALARQAAQQGIHFLARRAVGIAMEAQREPADLLDAVEDLGALLFAHGVA